MSSSFLPFRNLSGSLKGFTQEGGAETPVCLSEFILQIMQTIPISRQAVQGEENFLGQSWAKLSVVRSENTWALSLTVCPTLCFPAWGQPWEQRAPSPLLHREGTRNRGLTCSPEVHTGCRADRVHSVWFLTTLL